MRSTPWNPPLNGTCSGTATRTVYFDNDPLDLDNGDGALTEGTYEIYIKAEGDSGGIGPEGANLSGADSRGAAGNGPHLGLEFYSSGVFTISSGLVFNEPFTGANGSLWNATRWSTSSNGTTKKVDIQSNQGRLYVNTASARATANMTATPDSEVGFTYRFDNPTGKSYLRVVQRSANDNGYRVELRPDSSTVKLQSIVNGTSSTIDSFTYSANTTDANPENFRFRVQGDLLRVKIWPVGTAEPLTWQIDKSDPSVTNDGVVEINHNWSSSSTAAQAVYLDNLSVYDVSVDFKLMADTMRFQDRRYPENIGFFTMSADANYSGQVWVEHSGNKGCLSWEQDRTAEVWTNIRNSTDGYSSMDRWTNGVWMSNQGCKGTLSSDGLTFTYSNNNMDTGVGWDENHGNFLQDDGSYIGGRVQRTEAPAAFCASHGVSHPCGGRAFVQINWKKWVGTTPFPSASDDYRRREILHETGHSHGLIDCPWPGYDGMMMNGSCGWDNTITEWNADDREAVSSIYPTSINP